MKNKQDKKGEREAYFCYPKEKCVYISLKQKQPVTTN